ncbi:Succinyl-diaminopimelate desuccinylase [Roseivivax sp. THAF40]|uniref:succinyl-diaminopimelate desuccinylase n=1 Tax=unclassified Roseivivax TaxID=2639302 RepID=UPI001268FAC1|nr:MULTISPECIES: succinyl-diaminopimelate desuccinylase [unclassified Roseivivax]QFS81323.1 Succinyl-diaminopimelate desuccinylase [Roseivivax sp. THAF197b]QFT45052.1 Succinyl-diaminopimelate desuccinylase [Roseivivax sp. THAF40]
MTVDPVRLTADLIRCPSVTPEEGGALALLENHLSAAGFTCMRADRGEVSNLFARWGDKGHARTFGFNGHTDVVPLGNLADWSVDPFGAEEKDGQLWGRGATDMKSGVAAFAAAAMDFVKDTPPDGALILAITGDEEGPALDGTRALLDWMANQGEAMDVCLVGEPTCPSRMGEMMKIGRRGSMSAWITTRGVQGHAAYPHRAKNPCHALLRLLDGLATHELDRGTDHFDASSLQVVSMDVGNPATNVIPAEARGLLNIRFNDTHTGAALSDWLRAEAAKVDAAFGTVTEMEIKISGEAFLTPPGPLSDLVARAVEAETGIAPVLSTSGGTSDARFVRDHCPVVEFGLVGETMHQVDERVSVAQIHQLKAIYSRILRDFFA